MIIIAVCAVVRFQSAPLTILPRTATLSQPIPDALSLDWPSYGQAAVASSTAGAVFNILGDSYTGTTSATLTSSARMTSGVYRVDAGDTETFTLTVTLNPNAAGQYRVELDQVHYGISTGAAAYASTFEVDNDNSDFETDNAYVPS